MVERKADEEKVPIGEIRYREISTDEPAVDDLTLDIITYDTTVAREHFLQWIAPDGRIAGFLRLSLPDRSAVAERPELPVKPGEAMIREVHVYGKVAGLRKAGDGAQHLGLGRQLVERACSMAKEAGYRSVNVISSVGTREYYRSLGFTDNGLYQQRALD